MDSKEDRIAEVREKLEKAKKELAEENTDKWQRVWLKIDPDDLTEEQEYAWMLASDRHKEKLKKLNETVRELEAELDKLMK